MELGGFFLAVAIAIVLAVGVILLIWWVDYLANGKCSEIDNMTPEEWHKFGYGAYTPDKWEDADGCHCWTREGAWRDTLKAIKEDIERARREGKIK